MSSIGSTNEDDLTKVDLYDLLGVEAFAVDGDIKRAYRKKALTCHPDKNPDNPKAAELFRKLSKALQILIDPAAREAYDKVLRGRQAAAARTQQLDSKRRKLKEELEERERAAASATKKDLLAGEDDAVRLQKEIDRLRREGSETLKREEELIRKQIVEEIRLQKEKEMAAESLPRLKIKWNKKIHKITEDLLRKGLESFVTINFLLVGKKGNSAIVELAGVQDAIKAADRLPQLVDGIGPVEWISGRPTFVPSEPSSATVAATTTVTGSLSGSGTSLGSMGSMPADDYENAVLARLRQAAERHKRKVDEEQIASH